MTGDTPSLLPRTVEAVVEGGTGGAGGTLRGAGGGRDGPRHSQSTFSEELVLEETTLTWWNQ